MMSNSEKKEEEGDIFIPWWVCRMPAWLEEAKLSLDYEICASCSYTLKFLLLLPWTWCTLLSHICELETLHNETGLMMFVVVVLRSSSLSAGPVMIWYESINIPKLAGFILRPFDKFLLWKVVRRRGRGSVTTFEQHFYWDTFSGLAQWSMEKKICNGHAAPRQSLWVRVVLQLAPLLFSFVQSLGCCSQCSVTSTRVKRWQQTRNFQWTTMTKMASFFNKHGNSTYNAGVYGLQHSKLISGGTKISMISWKRFFAGLVEFWNPNRAERFGANIKERNALFFR